MLGSAIASAVLLRVPVASALFTEVEELEAVVFEVEDVLLGAVLDGGAFGSVVVVLLSAVRAWSERV
jgi:hypothetical protein